MNAAARHLPAPGQRTTRHVIEVDKALTFKEALADIAYLFSTTGLSLG